MPVSWQRTLCRSPGSACCVCPSPAPGTSELDQEIQCGHPKKLGGAGVFSSCAGLCAVSLQAAQGELCGGASPSQASILTCSLRMLV